MYVYVLCIYYLCIWTSIFVSIILNNVFGTYVFYVLSQNLNSFFALTASHLTSSEG